MSTGDIISATTDSEGMVTALIFFYFYYYFSPVVTGAAASSSLTIVLSVVVAVLLLLIVLGALGFTIITFWLVKAKSRARSPSHDAPIEMKANQAYGPVRRGNRGEMARSVEEEKHNIAEGTEEPEYEVIRE